MNTHRKQTGFTLLEVMFSIMILGVGLIAVLSLFPVAGVIQQNTFDTLSARRMADNIQVMIETRGFLATDLPPNPGSNDVLSGPVVQKYWDADNDGPGDWLPEDRSYPQTGGVHTRLYQWVPLFRDDNADPMEEDWEVYVLLVRMNPTGPTEQAGTGGSDAELDAGFMAWPRKVSVGGAGMGSTTLTGVNNLNGKFRIGGKTLDNKGNVYTITRAPRENGAEIEITPPIQSGGVTDIFWVSQGKEPTDPNEAEALEIIDVIQFGDEVIR